MTRHVARYGQRAICPLCGRSVGLREAAGGRGAAFYWHTREAGAGDGGPRMRALNQCPASDQLVAEVRP